MQSTDSTINLIALVMRLPHVMANRFYYLSNIAAGSAWKKCNIYSAKSIVLICDLSQVLAFCVEKDQLTNTAERVTDIEDSS
jgi:hypothetical protein